MPLRSVPANASQSEPGEDGKLFAPSAARNADIIAKTVAEFAPTRGRALELASGTGQHIVRMAAACPGLIWVPTDLDAARLTSIGAYVRDAQLTNLAPPVPLDACASGWSYTCGHLDLAVIINLAHLISADEAQTLLTECGTALNPGGRVLLYGPFMRNGVLTSEGDRSFDDSLRRSDPELGYKDDADILDWAHAGGMQVAARREMPANNLMFVFQKSQE